jgi:NAD kinase
MVASEEATIELLVANDHEGTVILDGRSLIGVQHRDVFKVERGVHTFQLVKVGATDFYQAVREKFNFQIRPGVLPSRPNSPHL